MTRYDEALKPPRQGRRGAAAEPGGAGRGAAALCARGSGFPECHLSGGCRVAERERFGVHAHADRDGSRGAIQGVGWRLGDCGLTGRDGDLLRGKLARGGVRVAGGAIAGAVDGRRREHGRRDRPVLAAPARRGGNTQRSIRRWSAEQVGGQRVPMAGRVGCEKAADLRDLIRREGGVRAEVMRQVRQDGGPGRLGRQAGRVGEVAGAALLGEDRVLRGGWDAAARQGG